MWKINNVVSHGGRGSKKGQKTVVHMVCVNFSVNISRTFIH